MDERIKIVLGLALIVVSFYYIIKNKRPMLDNLIVKSQEKYEKEYQQQQAIKEKAYAVVDGKADAFDTLTEGIRAAAKPVSDMVQEHNPVNKANREAEERRAAAEAAAQKEDSKLQ